MDNGKPSLGHCLKLYLIFFSLGLFSFLWLFSLIYNFNFFWEENGLIGEYEESFRNPDAFTTKNLAVRFFEIMIDPTQFYHLAYRERPLEFLMDDIIVKTLGLNLISLRMFRAFNAALLILLYSFFFYNIGKNKEEKTNPSVKNETLLLLLLLFLYTLMLPETWLLTLYVQDSLLWTIFFGTAALCLFFFFYEKPLSLLKWTLLSFLIIFLTEISLRIKHVGRLNGILILFFFLFTKPKQLFKPKYIMLLLGLLFVTVPLLGLFQGVIKGESVSSVLGLSQTISDQQGSSFHTILDFLKTFYHTFFPHAFFLVFLLFIFIGLHMYRYLTNKNIQDTETTIFLREQTIFYGLWFFFVAFLFFMARGFVFEPKSFLRFEFSIFIIPQALFVVSYAQFVYKKYFAEKKQIFYIICFLLLLALAHNAIRLNEWRGGWGAYFLGYDTSRQYVDAHAENAVLLVPFDWSSPTYFTTTNEIKMIHDITNSSIIKEFAGNYSAVYITSRKQQMYDDAEIINIANLTVNDQSPYGFLKRVIGKYYADPMYLYVLN